MSNIDVAALRRRLGLTQEQMARRVGVTPMTIRRWETRRFIPSPLAMEKLQALMAMAGQTRQGGTSND